MKKRFLILFLAAAMVMVMCGCGSSSDTSAQEDASAETTQEEDTSSDLDAEEFSYEKVAENYVFELEGKGYALPCTVSEFTDAGWYIQQEQLDFELEKNTTTLIFVYTDSNMDTSAFNLNVINLTDDTLKVSECIVGGINLAGRDSCTSLTLKKTGITIDISSVNNVLKAYEDMASAYGQPDASDSDDYYNRTWRFSDGHCWGEGINIQTSMEEDGSRTVTLYYHGPENQ